jgi:hypothetical protein
MAEDATIRRTNLRRLFAVRRWGAADLVKAAGKTYSYWNDLLKSDKKSFGEKAARSLESALGLPRGWLDQAEAEVPAAATSAAGEPQAAYRQAPTWPWRADLYYRMMELPPDELKRLEQIISAYLPSKD